MMLIQSGYYYGLMLFSALSFMNTTNALLCFSGNNNYYYNALFISNFLTSSSVSGPPRRVVEVHCHRMMHATTSIPLDFYIAYLNITERVPESFLKFDGVVFVVDLQCPNVKDLLHKAKTKQMFRKSNVWLLFGKTTGKSNNLIKAGDINFSKSCRVFSCTSNGTHIEVSHIFKLTQTSERFSVIPIGKWSQRNQLILFHHHHNNSSKLINFRGEPIKVSYALIYKESMKHLTDYRHPQQDQPSKITYLLIEQLCKLFNASHVAIFRKHWGDYDNKTKTYTPLTMFWDIQQGNADIAGNTAGTTHVRVQFFRFLAPTGNLNLNKLMWFFKAPPLSYTRNIWTLPFVKDLWLTIFIVIALWYVAIVVVALCESSHSTFNERNGCFVALDVVISTLTLRGSYITFSTYSGRLICYSLFVLVVLLNTGYSANFLVLLQSSGDSIRNFNDLLDIGMRLGSLDESYNVFYFTHPSDLVDEVVRRKIHSLILAGKNSFWVNASYGLQMVKDNVFAYHVPSTVGYDEIAKTYDEATKRSVRAVDSVIRLNSYLCVSKNSTLEEFLNYGFLYLQETGIMHRERTLLFPQKPSPDYSKAIFSSLDIIDVSFVFLILMAGVLLSALILIFELTTLII